MLSAEEIIDKAMERGYVLHNYSADKKQLNFIKNNGLGLLAYLNNDEEFELYYDIDLIFKVTGGKCGSFMNDKHFNSHEKEIEKYMNHLKQLK